MSSATEPRQKEEEKRLNPTSAVVQGGTIGTMLGLAGGTAGVLLAARRYHTIRNLTLPMKSFLATSSATFVGIVAADHASRNFEIQRSAEQRWLENREEQRRREETSQMSMRDRVFGFMHREKYKVVGVTWIASMVGSFWMVGRNPYLSGQQKIVQARVYAQGLTLAVLVASAGFEVSDQKRGKGILDAAQKKGPQVVEDVKDKGREVTDYDSTRMTTSNPTRDENADVWKDMVAAEEQRLKAKHKSLYEGHHGEGEDNDAHQQQEVSATQQPLDEKGHLKLEKDMQQQKMQQQTESSKA